MMAHVDGWKIESVGAYFAYVCHPFSRMTAVEVARRLASENGLLLIPGSYFGPGQEQYLRLSFGNLSADTVRDLPDRFILQ
jgi:aspartate/methionine/tyrosine aminotransferase